MSGIVVVLQSPDKEVTKKTQPHLWKSGSWFNYKFLNKVQFLANLYAVDCIIVALIA